VQPAQIENLGTIRLAGGRFIGPVRPRWLACTASVGTIKSPGRAPCFKRQAQSRSCMLCVPVFTSELNQTLSSPPH
jgi:hypothetical protein